MKGLFSTIYSAQSPVDMNDEPKYKKRPREESDKKLGLINGRLRSLIESREQVNNVYSHGYFENHYRKADGELKKLLNEKVKLAVSRMANKEECSVVRPRPQLQMPTIVINIGTS